MRRRIVLVSLLGLLVAGVTAGALAAATGSKKTPAAAKVITVNMFDFRFAFTPRPPLKTGVAYTFKMVNKGQAPHNFDIQGVKAGPVIGPGKTASFKLTFKKAGRLPY